MLSYNTIKKSNEMWKNQIGIDVDDATQIQLGELKQKREKMAGGNFDVRVPTLGDDSQAKIVKNVVDDVRN